MTDRDLLLNIVRIFDLYGPRQWDSLWQKHVDHLYSREGSALVFFGLGIIRGALQSFLQNVRVTPEQRDIVDSIFKSFIVPHEIIEQYKGGELPTECVEMAPGESTEVFSSEACNVIKFPLNARKDSE